MSIGKTLSLIPLALAGCAVTDTALTPVRWISDARVLNCNPTTLRKDDLLILTLGRGHGYELAINRDADDTPYFLVVQAPPPDMQVLMDTETFSSATRVELPTSIVGYKWVGDGGNEPVFTKPGAYTISVSDVLESESGGYECHVNYVG